MAFQQSKSSLMQTAFKVAGDIVAAEISVGALSGDAIDRLMQVEEEIFAELSSVFEETGEDTPSYQSTARQSNGRSGGSGRRELDPSTFELKYGKHAGKTLQDIWDDPSTKSYIRWAAYKSNNETVAGAAKRFLATVSSDEE